MNVSWSDLNKVQEPGDYAFRDGAITVKFAEVEIWNKRPDARFELMRKHPLQAQVRYFLGKQIEQTIAAAASVQLIYESSNGGLWRLTKDPVSGVPAVMHKPNNQSGGKASYIGIDKFLRGSPEGPQHQTLRKLMEVRGQTRHD